VNDTPLHRDCAVDATAKPTVYVGNELNNRRLSDSEIAALADTITAENIGSVLSPITEGTGRTDAALPDDWRTRCFVVRMDDRNYSVYAPNKTHWWGDFPPAWRKGHSAFDKDGGGVGNYITKQEAISALLRATDPNNAYDEKPGPSILTGPALAAELAKVKP